MKLHVYYASPKDDMAFDTIRGMVLVHNFTHIEFCTNPQECDRAMFLLSKASNFDEVMAIQEQLKLQDKPYDSFYIHGKAQELLNIEKLTVVDWDEAAILCILKKQQNNEKNNL